MRTTLGLEEQVRMPGLVSHNALPHMLETHDIFVAPCIIAPNGERDGIPNVIIEALSQGVPVVATDVSGIGEIVVHNTTGLLVPQRDPRALADAVRTLGTQREQALAMAEEGRRLVRRMFDPPTNIQALYTLYVESCNALRPMERSL
jgi:glycosyltransferase involved in cell wall biosynthesis